MGRLRTKKLNNEELSKLFIEEIKSWELKPIYTGTRFDILDSAFIDSTWYAALKCSSISNDNVFSVVGIIVPFRWDYPYAKFDPINIRNKVEKGVGTLTWGVCTEDCSIGNLPVSGIFECPKKVLKLLTPTQNEFAQFWRKACGAPAGKKQQIIEERLGFSY